MLKKWMPLFSLFLLFLISPISFAADLPEYQGVKPSSGETEAQLPSLTLRKKDACCDREIDVHRDRDPHGLSPQEVLALVKKKKVVKKPKPTTTPPTDESEGSR
ncbi:MAG: hypothetical protein OXB86_04025 [Bdellovibrionales bacterium]|nr:hypothetical protein [Bdellovibrionales bacterium]